MASLGISMANTVATRKTNSHRPRHRFPGPHATSPARSRSWHLHDQPHSAHRSRSVVTCPRGEHRLPACPFRQLAEKVFGTISPIRVLQRARWRRQAADDCTLAACAPQIFFSRGVIVDLIEVYSCFALDWPQCHSFLKQFRPTESPSFHICSVTMTKEWGRFLIREQT